MKRLVLAAGLILLGAPPAVWAQAAPPAPKAPAADAAATDEADPAESPDHVFGLGLVASAKGRQRDAIKYFTEAIRIQPDLASAFAERGASYFVVDQFDNALADFNEALRLEPDNTPLKENRALTFLKLKQYDKALMDYDAVLANSPGALQARRGGSMNHALYGRGLARLGSGDAAGAWDDINLARTQNPDVDKYFKQLEFEPAKVEKPAEGTLPGQSLVRYREAVSDFSKDPLLVRVTIVNDTDKSERTACITAPVLRNALRRELGVKDDLAGTTSAVAAALSNTDRVFHFAKPAALAALKIPYAPADVTTAEDELKYTDIPSYDGPMPGYRLKPEVAAALACLFVERGKQVRAGTQMLVQP